MQSLTKIGFYNVTTDEVCCPCTCVQYLYNNTFVGPGPFKDKDIYASIYKLA